MLDRFRGCLLGLAVGESRAIPETGRSADNTAMLLCVLHGYLESRQFDPQDIADRILGWHDTCSSDNDEMTSAACGYLRQGYNFERGGRDAFKDLLPDQRMSAASLARTVPAGLLHYHDDVHLIGESRVISGITHVDETCKLACVCLNLAVAHLLMADAHSLLYELVDFIEPRSELLGVALRTIPNLALTELPAGTQVAETLQTALWIAMHCTSYEEGLTLIIDRGENSCAVAGALLGTRFGVTGIPQRWLDSMEDRGLIDNCAQQLFRMCEESS